MATNELFEHGDHVTIVATDPATPKSGDPVHMGAVTGVALIDEAADGSVVIATRGVYMLPVKGTTGSNAAIAAGDKLYYVDANTPKLSATTSGVEFGKALAPVVSGATTTIPVLLGR